jgi:exodeoxyribonuclease VII small subunit
LELDDKAIAALSYEAARELLDEVVSALDDSSLPLGNLMQLWETGEKIAKVCDAHLTKAAEKLEDFPEAQ